MNKLLIPASRQYMHNDGSGLLTGYDELETEKVVNDLQNKLAVAMNLIKAVAHVGVDFGYGKYELTEEMIAEARVLTEKHTKE